MRSALYIKCTAAQQIKLSDYFDPYKMLYVIFWWVGGRGWGGEGPIDSFGLPPYNC